MIGSILVTTAAALLTAIGPNSVGAVITEPPKIEPDTIVLAEIARVLRPGGALVIIGQFGESASWDLAARGSGLDWMAELVVLWNVGNPRTRNFGSLFTHVNWYTKPGARHAFNSQRRSIYSNVIVCHKVPMEDRRHPQEKPVGLTNFLISLLTNSGDLVVDPYCGSGSTLVSAVMCDREFIGADTQAEYVTAAARRVAHFEIEDVEPVHLWINGRLQEV